MKTKGYNILFSPEGKTFSTEKMYELVEKQKQMSGNINFEIGGENVLNYSALGKNVV